MSQLKLIPVENVTNLRGRVERFLRSRDIAGGDRFESKCAFNGEFSNKFITPSNNLYEFLCFLTDAIPTGDVYLFGGVLRDFALFGRRGFNSDIDLVVDGDWSSFESYLSNFGAIRNKFGGYRLTVGGWPVDIWNARETWAITSGHVKFVSIASLTETTVLNWDAILMNWRTRSFICRDNYFEDIKIGLLDVVLIPNPNPLGMAVRVFRHLFLKEAKKITPKGASYLSDCTQKYSYSEIMEAELKSYGSTYIDESLYEFFRQLNVTNSDTLSNKFVEAGEIVRKQFSLF